jgi:hypothetical protein
MATDQTLTEQLAPLLNGTVIRPIAHAPEIAYIQMPAGWWLWIGGNDGSEQVTAYMERHHNPTINDLSDHLWNPNNLATSINFLRTKPLPRIVSDLNKRLVAPCDDLWQAVIAARAARDDAHAATEAIIAQLDRALPGLDYKSEHCRRERGSGHLVHSRNRHVNSAYVDVTDRTVNFDLRSIPLSLALTILDSINSMKKDKP